MFTAMVVIYFLNGEPKTKSQPLGNYPTLQACTNRGKSFAKVLDANPRAQGDRYDIYCIKNIASNYSSDSNAPINIQ